MSSAEYGERCAKNQIWIDLMHCMILSSIKAEENLRLKLALRGSLLVQGLLPIDVVSGFDFSDARMPADLDFLFYHPEDLLAIEQASSFPQCQVKPTDEFISDFHLMVESLTRILASASFSMDSDLAFYHFYHRWTNVSMTITKDSIKAVPIFVDEAYPSVKIEFDALINAEVHGVPSSRLHHGYIDIGSGDPFIGPVVNQTIIFGELQYDKPQNSGYYHTTQFPSVPIETLLAFKVHSSIQRATWRPKDVYDLGLLLPLLCKDSKSFRSSIHLAFASRNGSMEEELPKLLNGDFGPDKEKVWRAWMSTEIEIYFRDPFRTVDSAIKHISRILKNYL